MHTPEYGRGNYQINPCGLVGCFLVFSLPQAHPTSLTPSSELQATSKPASREHVDQRADSSPTTRLLSSPFSAVFPHRESLATAALQLCTHIAPCQTHRRVYGQGMTLCSKLFALCGCGGKKSYFEEMSMIFADSLPGTGRSKDSLYEPVLADSEREAVAELLGSYPSASLLLEWKLI